MIDPLILKLLQKVNRIAVFLYSYTGKSDPGADIWGKARKAPRPVEDMRSVTLVVYGKDVNQIKKAIRIIEEDVDNTFKSKVYSESIIKQFSTSQKNEIQNLQKAHDVDVSVETRIGRITVRGLVEDVMNASEKVHQMIRKAEAIQQEKQAAEMMSAMVEWCFLDAGSIPSKLEKYPPNINLQLEKALRKQEPKTSFCDSQGVKYIVDFTTYEEYPESDPSDSVKVIRKSKIDGSSFEIPPTWTSMDSKENVSVVTLLQNSQEYQDVQNDFVQSTGQTIVKIERIQNKMLLQQYEAKLKLLEGQNPAGTTNERKLWHGTANESVASINTYGFNRSYCGKNAVVHGNGVYFAVNASYSARDQYSPRDFNGNKRIYRCRVLTGEFCQGAQGMKVPPNKSNPGAGTTHILYDSVVDNVRNPGIFVIFNDTQAYPEYLITFQ